MNRKKLFFLSALISLLFNVFAEERQVYFFGAVSSSSDSSMIKLTEDLFFTQLLSLDDFSVTDKRSQTWTESVLEELKDSGDIILHAEIQETETGGWLCKLEAFDTRGNHNSVVSKVYEGYYKILMDAKATLKAVLENDSQTSSQAVTAKPENKAVSGLTLDSVSGTWKGDSLIDKIVILRGGRGFVIYQNGASMNIEVSISGNTLTAKQAGKPNASFFPDLPRQVALVAAQSADPIEWKMHLENNETLTGTKLTLVVADDNSSSTVEKALIPVTWNRQ